MHNKKLIYGGDYNPEQWLHMPEILEKDVELLKKAHMNEVTIGVFAWSALEPQEGEYHFEWMRKILDTMYENGISVMLATPSGARPKWMTDRYPEVLRVEEDRTRNLFGGRHNHCFTSPVYREKIYALDKKLSEEFGNHPAVTTWHISNELSGECHCIHCQKAFQGWLKKKYQTIEQLNYAWNTTFWSHCYQNFEQVESPSSKGETMLHGLNLDWKRFVTDQTADFVAWEKSAIRDGGSTLPVTINLMYDFQGLNYHKFKDLIDIVSWDNYPTWHKNAVPVTAMDTAMQHDFMRSIMKKPFYLMESCPSSTNWQSVSKLKRPGMLSAASLQAIAHGADSVQYFQIRQSRGASEKFHGALIDHYGESDTRVFRECTKVGEQLEKLSELTGSNMKSRVAIIHDCENRWAMEDAQGPRNKDLHYLDAVKKMYGGLRKQGLNVDLIDMEDQLTEYDIVFAPMLYLFRADIEAKIRAFVQKGGTFVMTYWSGIVDENDLCHLGGTPHNLMDVFGLRSTELDALYDGESNSGICNSDFLTKNKSYTCTNFCDLVKADQAETLLTYEKDFYEGYPALTRNTFGKGQAYYICADFDEQFYDEFCKKVVADKGIKGVDFAIPEGIEVTMRENEKAEYLFIQNFSEDEINIDIQTGEYESLLDFFDGTVGKYETVILRRQK